MDTPGSARNVVKAGGEVVAVLRRVFAENFRSYLPQYAIAVACLVSIAGATAFIAWLIRDIIDDLLFGRRYDLIPIICASVILAFTVRGLATYGQAVMLARIGNNLVARYQQRIFDHLMRLGIGFFNEARSGQLAARINQNVEGVRDLMSMTVTSIARDVVTLLALVGVMVAQDPALSLAAFVIGPPLIYFVNRLMRRLRRVTRELVEINSRLLGALQETTQGIAIVKAFTMEEQLSQKISLLIRNAEDRANKIARVSERTSPIAEILAGFAIAGVVALAGYRAVTTGQPPGAVAAFVTALLLAYDPARRLARTQVNLERAIVNARMVYEILDLEPRQGDLPGARDIEVADGRIVFENVAFSYQPGTPVLHGVSFAVEAGRTTAIVGSSGAGKSTIVGLLQRFYDPDSGRITIDGQDIADVTKVSLRRSIAYVSQQPYLFEGTIRDNIRYGRPGASDAEIEQAARLAFAEEFILTQPQGYDTPVGEGGATMSGGQRQRLSIARAILRDAPILLLDEATSALDNESEARVQKALEGFMKGRTAIVIAHRLSTVLNADAIVVLDEGRLVESGTHAELIDDPDSAYARFHRLQRRKDTGSDGEDRAAAAPARRRAKR